MGKLGAILLPALCGRSCSGFVSKAAAPRVPAAIPQLGLVGTSAASGAAAPPRSAGLQGPAVATAAQCLTAGAMLVAAGGAAIRRRARPGAALQRLARGAAGRITPQQPTLWPAPRSTTPATASSIATVAPRRAAVVAAPPETFRGTTTDSQFNVPEGVQLKLGKDLLLKPTHPLGILWVAIQDYFKSKDPAMKFFDKEVPIVSTQQCFDNLRVPPEHPSRSPSDTYYVNSEMVLRTHTSAHQCQFMGKFPEITSFLCAGDVYRRDEIDASHYPVFHQCEGVRLFSTDEKSVEEIKEDLKQTLEGLAAHLFQLKVGEDTMRWLDEYFPFTEPSLELEIFYNDDWMEVLGCGVIHHDVLRNAGLDPSKVHGWAFGLGLERLAMVLFGIPDIRLFWSEDPRFTEQFDTSSFTSKTRFKPFSKYPPVLKDISMWIPSGFVDNDLFEMIRDEGGDQVEKVELMDEFTHPKTQRTSKMFRVVWRDMSRTLTNEEVNAKHEKVLERVVTELQVELR